MKRRPVRRRWTCRGCNIAFGFTAITLGIAVFVILIFGVLQMWKSPQRSPVIFLRKTVEVEGKVEKVVKILTKDGKDIVLCRIGCEGRTFWVSGCPPLKEGILVRVRGRLTSDVILYGRSEAGGEIPYYFGKVLEAQSVEVLSEK